MLFIWCKCIYTLWTRFFCRHITLLMDSKCHPNGMFLIYHFNKPYAPACRRATPQLHRVHHCAAPPLPQPLSARIILFTAAWCAILFAARIFSASAYMWYGCATHVSRTKSHLTCSVNLSESKQKNHANERAPSRRRQRARIYAPPPPPRRAQ